MIFVATSLCAGNRADAQVTSAPPADPRGLFVYSWKIPLTDAPTSVPDYPFAAGLVAAVNAPGIDGITLVEPWNAIQTARHKFVWTDSNGNDPSTSSSCTSPNALSLFAQWMCWAHANGKKVDLSVPAGVGTPSWLFTPDGNPQTPVATQLHFQVTPHQGVSGQACEDVYMAAPWDSAFLTEWTSMLGALATHLKQIGTYDAIAQIRLTGINRTTDEFRLPEEVSACPGYNAVDIWLNQAKPRFRPSHLLQAWDQITAAFRANFPDKFVNLPIIPPNTGAQQGTQDNQYPFPPIDENGCVYANEVPAGAVWTKQPCFNASLKTVQSNAPLLRLASERFPGRLTVAFFNLTLGVQVNQAVIRDANTLRTGAAFQMNDYFGATTPGNATACSPPPPVSPVDCTPPQYQQLLDQGIFPKGPGDVLRAQWLELFYPDVLKFAYPNASYPGLPPPIPQAHSELMAPPFVAMSFPPAPATGWFATPVSGVLTITSATGQTVDKGSISCIDGTAHVGPSGPPSVYASRQGNPTHVFCTAADQAGNVGLSIGYALPIDTQPPATTASVVTLAHGVPRVDLMATDNLSGVAQTEYSLDHGQTWKTGTSFVPPPLGTLRILFRSIDVAGNVESPKSITVTYNGIQ